ncbi:MAG: ABC transporter permease [Candidatus Margulisbacteria bacterium]|nr:ABC transporter permease [Candidatus Margulisiibacteriota bacterium]MBU1022500.1 ABC transporter permease [Candidatus Margulisiibacteriota bacterium]MBU1728484.1 ABC transporter permease [Candidatus Margulisiibacteriota bacterium]MBU1954631.1 ABC transporter permease [Candidatus Margulisiibacteriota bacterium]
MALIELTGISKTYNPDSNVPVHALNNVSLSIEPGEFVAIMGPSGSGKSTLLAILGLLDKLDTGQYKLLDKDITNFPENSITHLRNKFFGFVFQMFNLLPRLNVTENAMLPFIYANQTSSHDRERVVNVIKQVGLGARLHHRPNQLSGGEQQRVAVARAVANQPLVVLADEPTGNLDSKSTAEIITLLTELNRQGKTIIMVTHEHELTECARRVITLRDGRIESDHNKEKPQKFDLPLVSLEKKQHEKLFTLARIGNYCHEAILSLFHNKLRSFLSTLGVLIGVAAVIAMLAMGTGAKMQVEERLSALGTNLLMVRTSRSHGGIALGASAVTRFNFADMKAIEKIGSVEYVVPYVGGRAQVVYQSENWNTSVLGVGANYQHVRDAVPDQGRFFTESEVNTRAKVVVLGKEVADELFGEQNPVGKFVRVNRVSFKVIGVFPEKGVTGWSNFDDQIIMPVTTAMYRLLGLDYISYFDIQVKDTASMPLVQEEIVETISQLHRLSANQQESIDVRNLAEIQEAAGEMMQALSLLLGAIAAVSLLVGGIGIMNIMLVMVMERTHEIGLRKALGAKRSDIMVQFLIETVLICVLGGVFGIMLGSLIAIAMSMFAGWATVVSFGSIVLAFTFSVMVGLVFGLWPAWRAAKLLPIEALRYE